MKKARSNPAAEGKPDVSDAVDAFRRILRELRVVARRTELATGLSAAQMFVLSAVDSTPGCSINDLAKSTMTDRSSVATIVDRLAETAYVSREASGDDRRRASVVLTARGRRAVNTAKSPAPTALLIQGLEKLSPTRLHDLARGLIALTTEMGIADQPAAMLFEDSHRERRSRRGATRARERRVSA
jgi:DNA-binding MarR family transcriptional regulator